MNTRQQILDTALGLFNESGTGVISTNHISEAMGISPGNLYYHFRNKEEIIRAIFERLFAVWDQVFSLPQDQSPTIKDLERLVYANFQVMWDYRFIYRELIALLRRDPELHSRYQEIRQRGFSDYQQLFSAFVEAGVLVPSSDPQAVQSLAELCWLISEFWLSSVEVSGRSVDQKQMQHGLELMYQVLQPFMR